MLGSGNDGVMSQQPLKRAGRAPGRAEGARARDPRLDFFRGVGMIIILLAHIPTNPWADWIPARFGFSDATEIFVFCSGVASALAFGRAFESAGWLLGSGRILHRIWQVYRAHIGVFVATVAVLAGADLLAGSDRYLRHDLNLWPLLDAPGQRLLELVTLTYVPNYFDILPMYLVILALVPLVMAASRLGMLAVGLLVAALWLLASFHWLDLTAETWSGRVWFFNPFSWQLLFFLGFAFGRGWLAPPAYDRRLMLAAAAAIVTAAPFSCQYGWVCFAGYGYAPWLGEVHQALAPVIDKTHLGAFRVLHFLAIAYLAYILAGEGGRRLSGALVREASRVGRQTLPVFLSGLVLAQALGAGLDITGRSVLTVTIANLGGCALLMLVAATAEWFKSEPWSHARAGRRLKAAVPTRSDPGPAFPSVGSDRAQVPAA
jgi:hypothetical protein